MNTQLKGVDPRAKRTHQLLQQALLDLLQEKRFASVTVQEIAERARVNRTTFYVHFEDKYHLLDSLLREQLQREVASKLPPGSRRAVSTLQALIEAMFDFLGKVQSQWKPMDTQFELLFERIVQEELAGILLRWLKQVPTSGMGRRVPVATVASVISWAMVGAAAQWSRGARTISAEQMVNQIVIVITEGAARLIPGLGLSP